MEAQLSRRTAAPSAGIFGEFLQLAAVERCQVWCSGENLKGGSRKSLAHALGAKAKNNDMDIHNLELQKHCFKK